jgi:hypothetical protein
MSSLMNKIVMNKKCELTAVGLVLRSGIFVYFFIIPLSPMRPM